MRLPQLNQTSGFEKIVSVGMFEHVGESQLPLYFQHAWHLLRPGGFSSTMGSPIGLIDPEPRVRISSESLCFS